MKPFVKTTNRMVPTALATGFLLTSICVTACGPAASPSASDPKIIGGTEVPRDQNDARRFSTVALTTDLESEPDTPSPMASGKSFCTGTVIAPKIVVTAAHCLQKFDPMTWKKGELTFPRHRDFVVYFDAKVEVGQQGVRARKVVPHPDWDPAATLSPTSKDPPHDIGLIFLNRPIPDRYRPVRLAPRSFRLQAGDEVHLSGYGVTELRTRNDTGILRQVVTKFQSIDLERRLVTVGGNQRGACGGDSGGPLFVKNGNRLQLIGATSTGAEDNGRCLGERNNYTDIRAYKDWIRRATNRNAN